MSVRTPFRISTAVLLVSTGLMTNAWCGPTLNVTDQKGRSIEIELISATGQSVTFRRAGKEYTLPISQFDAASQERISKEASALPASPLKITADVVIGKRRRKDDSYYMVKQDVSCTVKLTNAASTGQTPTLTGRVIFFGQNQRQAEIYTVLSTQTFTTQVSAGETFLKEMEEFTTTYDSDNKGYGNVGGFQYFGYLLVLQDANGEIVFDQTTSGSIRQTLNNKPSLTKAILGYPQNQKINSKLEPVTGS